MRRALLVLVLAGGFLPEVFAEPSARETNAPGPRIHFAETVFDFGRVKSGERVNHIWSFTNVGDQVLEITNVLTACGCTTAGAWSRRVDPGQAGQVPIEFDSTGLNGEVFKTIGVASTDTNHPMVLLQFKGTVWKPVDVVPSFAVLTVSPDAATASTTVKIINHTEEYMALAGPPHCSTSALRVVARTNQPGKEFQLDITSVPPLAPGNFLAQITLKTTSTNLPLVLVSVWTVVQPALSVVPSQVLLPPPPLVARTVATVTVQSNGTNTFSLSHLSTGLRRVEVSKTEKAPGRAYLLTLSFPGGFQLPSGKPAALSFKTSLAQFPVVKVPIVHATKAVAPTPSSNSVGKMP